jgi:hypothetical protein
LAGTVTANGKTDRRTAKQTDAVDYHEERTKARDSDMNDDSDPKNNKAEIINDLGTAKERKYRRQRRKKRR